jgi:tetratricopeptide (TPR) repeat protein
MLHRILMKRRLAAALFAGVMGAASFAWAAPADDLKEAQKLYGQQKLQPALDKIEVYLKAMPRDPQGRFLKGLILTEQKRVPDAIQVFTGLTEDFPELPEPYNNLAVLYASQGNYDKAKSALELAIHTHPSYATAHENLGDIYAQLASRAYDRALQLDKTNTTAQLKLAMVKDLFSSQKLAAANAPRVEAAKAPVAAAVPSAKAEPPKSEPPKPSPPVVAPVEVKPPPPVAAPAPGTAPAASNGDGNKAQAVAAVESWAKAWAAKDVKAYLAHYAFDFEVPGGGTRAAWEKDRAARIERPKTIEVGVKVLNVQASDTEATVTFRQSYQSDTLKSNNTKTLSLVKQGERWLIKQERTGG